MLPSKTQVAAIAIAFLALAIRAKAADQPDCTVTHSNGKFYDLRPLMREDDKDWTPDTGSDNSIDFKLNVCHTLLKKDLDVKYPDEVASWGKRNKGFSLGKLSKNPMFRGDSLILEYRDGDDCPNTNSVHKRSTLIRFICDNSVSGQGNPYLLSNSEDDCNYWFEWRTPVACSVEKPSGGGASAGGVFGTIVGVAIVVYIAGGVAYNRIVNNARGLKQIPNYKAWAEAFDFIKDMVVILISKCYKPRRTQTYHHLPVDSEINTLIDDYEDDEV